MDNICFYNDYLSTFLQMTQLWQVVLTLLQTQLVVKRDFQLRIILNSSNLYATMIFTNLKKLGTRNTLLFLECQKDTFGDFLDIPEDTIFEIWASRNTFGSKIQP